MAELNLYEFGEFTLDLSERRFSRNGAVVPLAPKALDLLAALVRSRGRLVTKRELLDRVWPQAFVEEGILAVHIAALRKALGDSARGGRCIETVPRSGYRFVAEIRPPTDSLAPREGAAWSLAVLPAVPPDGESSPDPDGPTAFALTDDLIGRLGRFDGLVVRPMRAVRAFGDAHFDAGATGRSLRVDAVAEIRLLRTDRTVGVSVRLLRSRDGACLWRGEFEEPRGRIAVIPAAVAESLGAHLRLSEHHAGVSAGEDAQSASAERPTRSAEVFELFGRGRAALLSGSSFDLPKAIESFRAAIALDPGYASAHAGLALACCTQAELRLAPPAKAYAEAKAAALRALAIDPDCADAQTALGAVLFVSEWDWMGAERSLRRALELNPNHTEAHLLLGRLLDARGRLGEGLEAKLAALERDPLSSMVHVQIALSYWNRRDFDGVITWANKALEIDPRHLLAREFLASAYWKKGDLDRHMAESLRHAEVAGAPREVIVELQGIYERGGRPAIVAFALERLSSAGPAGDVQAAILCGEVHDLDSAFRRLESAIDRRDPSLVDLAVAPQWDSLRDDPRFPTCLSRMGLPVP
jgi:DNA-binding winged helix-turn-helix (wHTH) protein/cytochrome c-type biogenesis protein CcmH/NrfG